MYINLEELNSMRFSLELYIIESPLEYVRKFALNGTSNENKNIDSDISNIIIFIVYFLAEVKVMDPSTGFEPMMTGSKPAALPLG